MNNLELLHAELLDSFRHSGGLLVKLLFVIHSVDHPPTSSLLTASVLRLLSAPRSFGSSEDFTSSPRLRMASRRTSLPKF